MPTRSRTRSSSSRTDDRNERGLFLASSQMKFHSAHVVRPCLSLINARQKGGISWDMRMLNPFKHIYRPFGFPLNQPERGNYPQHHPYRHIQHIYTHMFPGCFAGSRLLQGEKCVACQMGQPFPNLEFCTQPSSVLSHHVASLVSASPQGPRCPMTDTLL